MQSVKGSKLGQIEKALRTSPELWVAKSQRKLGFGSVLRKEYSELVQLFVAPVEPVRNLKELSAVRDGILQKVGFGPSYRPEIFFTKVGKTTDEKKTVYGVTMAEIIYSERDPKLVTANEMDGLITGLNRDIRVVIYPNTKMAQVFATPEFTSDQMAANSLTFSKEDKRKLEEAASIFNLTVKERIGHDFGSLKREALGVE